MDILVKPMQRLTKYSLLLKAVHKKTDAEEHKPVVIEMVCLFFSSFFYYWFLIFVIHIFFLIFSGGNENRFKVSSRLLVKLTRPWDSDTNKNACVKSSLALNLMTWSRRRTKKWNGLLSLIATWTLPNRCPSVPKTKDAIFSLREI